MWSKPTPVLVPAAITGAWSAVARATEKLESEGPLGASSILGQGAAVPVGLVDWHPLLNLNYGEAAEPTWI